MIIHRLFTSLPAPVVRFSSSRLTNSFKMSPQVTLFQLFFFLLCAASYIHGQSLKRRFEYKYSFKGPHLVQRDKSVPFWEYFDDTLAGDEGIRITPSLRSKKGSVWTKNKFEAKGWEIEVGVRVTGRGRIGADGMAIWFTDERSHSEDPNQNVVFGATDRWNGLGLILDSFDNDGKGNNPYIMAVTNDGSISYDHQKLESSMSDGAGQSLGGCMRDFRNKPFPVRIKITYYNQILTVKVHNGVNNNADDYDLCMSALNIVLPPAGYIGVSAATGGLADDHDVMYLLTHSLTDQTSESAQVSETERLKFEKEFEQYQQELSQAKEQYKKEHPDQKDNDFEDEENWYQNQNEKELQMIFDGQSGIQTALKEVVRRLDEMVGRQEMVLSRVNSISVGGQGQAPPVQQVGQQPNQQGGQQLPLQRHEVDRMMNNQNGMVQQMNDLRYIVNDVQAKVNAIQTRGVPVSGGPPAHGAPPGGAANAMQDQMLLHELRDRLNNVGNGINTLVNRPQASVQCPTVTGCVSTTFFVLAIVVQFVLTIGYMVYRSNKEQQAKKFY